jgi:hypothetical protein
MTWMLLLMLAQQAPSPAPSPVATPLSLQKPSQADQIRAAMAASIEKQLASVKLQSQAVGVVTDSPAADKPFDKPENNLQLSAMIGNLINRAQ